MQKIIIHMGQYKTGSTSIQNMLWSSREQLLERGFCYPKSLTRDGAHFGVTDLLRKEYWNAGEYADLDPLRAEIDASESDCGIISCEALSGATLRRFSPDMMQYMWHRLVKLFEGLEINVVFYARRQDESIDSRIIQEIKGRGRKYDINYVRFLYEKSSLNYYYYYRLLEDVFGVGQVEVRLYDRNKLVGSDVRNDFLDYLGITNDCIPIPYEEDNVAPSYKLIAMYRIINSLPLSEDEYLAINEGLWKEFGASGGTKAVVLGKEERNEVMGYFKEYNTMFIEDCVSPNDKKVFEDALFGPCKQVMPNIYIDGVDVVRYFQSKGFELCKAG